MRLNKITLKHQRGMMQFFNALSSTQQGVSLALISSALFITVGVMVRQLSSNIDPLQILFFRQIIFIALLLPAITRNLPTLLKPNKVPLHLLRVFAAFISLYLGFLTVSHLPFADATALGFTQVLFVAFISHLFLAEQIKLTRKITIIVGFIGVMLVVRPSFQDVALLYILTGVISALGAAVAVVCVRKVSQTEPRITLLAYQAIFVALIVMLPSIYVWQWPTSNQWVLLMLVGVISSIAQWVGVTAYKYAQANVVANVEYVKIIYSLLIGYWLFSEVPDMFAIIGAMIIILSAVLPSLFNVFTKRGQ